MNVWSLIAGLSWLFVAVLACIEGKWADGAQSAAIGALFIRIVYLENGARG